MSTIITHLLLKNVRCFGGEQRAALSKVTLLVGENSVGKSTFLGCVNGVAQLCSLVELADGVNSFDQEPFFMGSFQNLVRSSCSAFQLGVGLDGDCFRHFNVEFAGGPGGGLRETTLDVELSDDDRPNARAALQISRRRSAPPNVDERWRLDGPGFEFRLDQADVSYTQFTTWLSRSVRYGLLPFGGEMTQYRKRVGGKVSDQEAAAFGKFVNFFRHRFRQPGVPLSVIPIDPSSWERTRYYPVDPLGVGDGRTDPDAIGDIGRHLGLFGRIETRERAPQRYEVLVDISGEMRNLADVGYGVTNVLPLAKAIVDAPAATQFLLQQPEVHIHPSAQAKLVEMMAGSPHRFIIETHSDHIIDWFRILVTEERMAPSDFGIVYFERLPDDPSATRLHQLSVDGSGNLIGQPNDYRQFFSAETARLLGLPT